MTLVQYIQALSQLQPKSIENTLTLLAEGGTIPFISRYRKDATGNLDEVAIEQIQKLQKQYEEIVKRKESILKSIEEQNSLTPELQQKIEQSFSLQELEDLYLPYKKRRKTKADTARESGLEPLAKIIMAQNANHLEHTAQKYISDKISTAQESLDGACNIIAEWINENLFIRKRLRQLFQRQAKITSKITKKPKKTRTKLRNINNILIGAKFYSKLPPIGC